MEGAWKGVRQAPQGPSGHAEGTSRSLRTMGRPTMQAWAAAQSGTDHLESSPGPASLVVAGCPWGVGGRHSDALDAPEQPNESLGTVPVFPLAIFTGVPAPDLPPVVGAEERIHHRCVSTARRYAWAPAAIRSSQPGRQRARLEVRTVVTSRLFSKLDRLSYQESTSMAYQSRSRSWLFTKLALQIRRMKFGDFGGR